MAETGNIDTLEHNHVFLGASHDENARRTLWVVALTAVMMVGEIIAGYVTRSEEHTSELQSLMRISYAVFCLKKKKNTDNKRTWNGRATKGQLTTHTKNNTQRH